MISLERIPNIAAIDDYLSHLEKREPSDLSLPLRLPDSGIGFKVALIQLILTWARLNPANRLIVPAKKEQTASAYLRTLCASEHGLVGVLVAPRVEAVQGINLGPSAINECHAAYAKISREPTSNPDGSFFLVSNRLGHLEHAYDHLSPKTAPPTRIEWFKAEVNRHLERCVSQSGGKHFAPGDSRDIAEIVYEVFANAEEWGSKDIDGQDIRPNVRGLLLTVHDIGEEHISNRNISTPTAKYFQQWERDENAALKFLEVSIFDAGMGLAQHALRRPVTETTSLKEEYDMVMKCLRKYASASGRTFRGLGLHHVMSLLTKTKGFLRYRSGRLSLFRDFHEQPFMPAIGRETIDPTRHSKFRSLNIYFFDWGSQTADLIPAPWADGALFTMIFPLKPADQQLRFREVLPIPKTE
jgi:hypothetical protein